MEMSMWLWKLQVQLRLVFSRASSIKFLKCHFQVNYPWSTNCCRLSQLCQYKLWRPQGIWKWEWCWSRGRVLVKDQRERQWGSVKLFLFLTDFLHLGIFTVHKIISSTRSIEFFSPVLLVPVNMCEILKTQERSGRSLIDWISEES